MWGVSSEDTSKHWPCELRRRLLLEGRPLLGRSAVGDPGLAEPAGRFGVGGGGTRGGSGFVSKSISFSSVSSPWILNGVLHPEVWQVRLD